MLSPDYAQFTLDNGKIIPGERMLQKLKAVPIPDDLTGKKVLDVGCDYGQFSFLCASRGADVLGLDRNREVRGVGFRDLVAINKAQNIPNTDFRLLNLGKQWHEYGRFDVILMLSCYHHVYENCGDHKPIWFWLWRHCAQDGYVLWENPLDDTDKVVSMNVKREGYNRENILSAAQIYFDVEYIGPAIHEPNRHVFRFKPKTGLRNEYCIAIQEGAGGASKAFTHNDNKRIRQIHDAIGITPIPGSLNAITHKPFFWNFHYYVADIDDVVDRAYGLNSEWRPKAAYIYPVDVWGQAESSDSHHSTRAQGYVFRFKGEKYPVDFVEIIANSKLRDINPREIHTCE